MTLKPLISVCIVALMLKVWWCDFHPDDCSGIVVGSFYDNSVKASFFIIRVNKKKIEKIPVRHIEKSEFVEVKP